MDGVDSPIAVLRSRTRPRRSICKKKSQQGEINKSSQLIAASMNFTEERKQRDSTRHDRTRGTARKGTLTPVIGGRAEAIATQDGVQSTANVMEEWFVTGVVGERQNGSSD